MRVHRLFVIALALSACGKKSEDNGPGGTSGPTTATPGNSSVSGLVLDSNTGTGLSGAAVSAGGQSATTDSRGYFTLTGLNTGATTVAVSKDGYAPGFTIAKAGDKAESALVTLKKEGAKQAYSPATNATLVERTDAGPYAVIFAAGSLNTTDGNLSVTITPVDPTKEQAVLPGSLVTTSSTVLFPVTFAEFTIRDSAGNRVQLKDGQSATVELPIPPRLRDQYALNAKIHCYAFNATTGAWDDFVDGTVRVSSVDNATPVLAAQIKHFSWYGGAPEGNDCFDVAGQVVSAVDGKPLGNARVEATPGGNTYTDADGNFTVLGSGASTEFFAYQMGYDVDGSLTGVAGAKYIEYGRVNVSLSGLTAVPCNNSAAAGANPPAGTLGGPDNRVKLSIGSIGKFAYNVTAILTAGVGQSAFQAIVEQGIPDEHGHLTMTTEAAGAKISISHGATTEQLESFAGVPGIYALSATSTFAVAKGQTYQLRVDADGNGSVDGEGTASVVGDLAFTTPASGGDYAAAGFKPVWIDSGHGNAGYTAVYITEIRDADGAPVSFYIGSDLTYTATQSIYFGPSTGNPLPAGSYTAKLTGYSGFIAAAAGNFSQTNNITGLGITGQTYSASQATEVSFTLH